MRGVILLTEARSGSNWVGSLARNAGLGNSGEWLDPKQSGLDPSQMSFEEYLRGIIEISSSKSSAFFVKIFPGHLFATHRNYKRDFIQEVCKRHDTKLLLLTRRDRLRQAISFTRGLQTQQWTSKSDIQREPSYDFDRISRLYFQIGRSYDFWESYVEMYGYPADRFVYEDLVENPTPFLASVAEAMGAPMPDVPKSELRVQRDQTTEEWLERFREELANRDCLDNLTPARLPARNLSNLRRFLTKSQMKPYPYYY